jgi:hypothetical protein
MFKTIIKWLLPENYKRMIMNFKTLSTGYGQWESIKREMCIDAQKNPIPWYTYPAIEYLRQLDVSDKSVFEFGCGNSSLFWAQRAKEVISIEDNKIWYETIRKLKNDNQQVVLVEEKTDYISYISKLNRHFDIIIVDGQYRFDCANNALNYLKDKGMIILDNSDWYPNTSELLRNHGLIEIDFSGFGPINNYTWTTSLYLSRKFKIEPMNNIQPFPPIGGIRQYGEDERDC